MFFTVIISVRLVLLKCVGLAVILFNVQTCLIKLILVELRQRLKTILW